MATVSFLNDLIVLNPKGKFVLNWAGGKSNSADLVSKYDKQPVMLAGGKFFRKSGFDLLVIKKTIENIFFELTQDQCIYTPLLLNEADKKLIGGPNTYIGEGKINENLGQDKVAKFDRSITAADKVHKGG